MDQIKDTYQLIKGNIYTKFYPVDMDPTKIECFIVNNGKFIFCGSLNDAIIILKKVQPNIDKVIDELIHSKTMNQIQFENIELILFPPNQMIMPGFIDSHCHPMSGATQHDQCKLHDCSTWEEAQTLITQYFSVNKFTEQQWIFIYGYSQSWFNNMEQKIQLLDNITTKNPLVLMRDDTHSYWINSKTLMVCGINKETKVPENGIISYDSEGQLNGSFSENAMPMIRKNFPPRKSADHLDTLKKALSIIVKYGIVGFCDAAVKETMFETYLNLYQSKDLKPWAYLCLSWNQLFLDQIQAQDIAMNFSHLDKLVDQYQDLVQQDKINPQELQCKSVKLFIDGVLESKSALLKNSYCNCQKDLTEEHGILMIQVPELEEILEHLSKKNLQAHMHSIGDASTDLIINSLNKLQLNKEVRNYVAHLQFVSEYSLTQFADLNLGANFSPLWFYEVPDKSVLNFSVSKQMIDAMYPIRQLADNKVNIGFGSDWPVSSLNPLDGIERATTRQPLGYTGPFIPIGNIDQIISLQEALHMYTLGSAWLLRSEQLSGSIEVGKRADFICIDQDLFKINLNQISSSRVQMTYINGLKIYDSNPQKL